MFVNKFKILLFDYRRDPVSYTHLDVYKRQETEYKRQDKRIAKGIGEK